MGFEEETDEVDTMEGKRLPTSEELFGDILGPEPSLVPVPKLTEEEVAEQLNVLEEIAKSDEKETNISSKDAYDIVVRHITENLRNEPDSLELGTGKVGVIKVYGNFSNKDEFRQKIDNALELRNYANTKTAVADK